MFSRLARVIVPMKLNKLLVLVRLHILIFAGSMDFLRLHGLYLGSFVFAQVSST